MGWKESSGVCSNCGTRRRTRKKTCNHVLHLILSIITAGLWVIIWIFEVITDASTKYNCVECGLPVKQS